MTVRFAREGTTPGPVYGSGAAAGGCSVGNPGGECLGQAGGVVAGPADVTVGAYEDGAGGELGCRVGPDDEGGVRAVGQLGPVSVAPSSRGVSWLVDTAAHGSSWPAPPVQNPRP
jgi:hypothetical protein